jgi:hypothetical protein
MVWKELLAFGSINHPRLECFKRTVAIAARAVDAGLKSGALNLAAFTDSKSDTADGLSENVVLGDLEDRQHSLTGIVRGAGGGDIAVVDVVCAGGINADSAQSQQGGCKETHD